MPQKKLSIGEVVERLINLSKVINNRMGLKFQEEGRVDKAFSLLAAKRSKGGYAVVLCAALGPTMVLSLRDHDRVELVIHLEGKKDDIAKEELQALANKYTDKHLRRNGMTSLLYTVDLCSFLTQHAEKSF
ncbi:hypothetical protein V2G26_019102 [Clonostachys chloroleuca]